MAKEFKLRYKIKGSLFRRVYNNIVEAMRYAKILRDNGIEVKTNFEQ